jgi:fructose-bisphosphate aldolase class I
VDINSTTKAEAEVMLKKAMLEQLDALDENQLVMLKLTLPEETNFYAECIAHPNVVKVVALSGGYSQDVANTKLSANNGMIASFSRALSEGISAKQSDSEFDDALDAAIASIYDASNT